MASYGKGEAREWAREKFRGVYNVVIPSFTPDLRGLNECGIRHDIRTELDYGFAGALLVSEVVISAEEYGRFIEVANDESKGRLNLIHHASFNTLEENIEAVRRAEAGGAELVLLSYPSNFYAETAQDIYDYTKAFCDATSLGIILFPMPLWGFDRVHASDIEAPLIARLLKDCPNISAIKAEGGYPNVMGFVECYRLFGKEVVVTTPVVSDMIPLAQLVPLQVTATSNTEYYGPMVPRIFGLIQDGNFDEATRLYWQLQPAFRANYVAGAHLNLTLFIHRMAWKFQAWLNGFNGGPLRQPTMRLNEGHMNALRQGLIRAGLKPTELPNRDFFVGRT